MYFGYAINHDGRKFSDPDVFRPERFLDEDGRYAKRDDAVLSFGVGKRRCPGEVLAQAELFLFLAAVVQNFR